MRRYVQRLTSGGAALLVCTLFVMGGNPRTAYAFAREDCVFEATSDGVDLAAMPVIDQLVEITPGTSSCTLTVPPGIIGMVCDLLDPPTTVDLTGDWEVTFANEFPPGMVNFTTNSLSLNNINMGKFNLCGFEHEVTDHTMDTQTFTYNIMTEKLRGNSTDTIKSKLTGMPGEVAAFKFGRYTGTITNFSGEEPGETPGIMTLKFEYHGTWVPRGGLPALSLLGVGVLTALLAGGGGFLLWRRRARSI